MTRGGYTLLPRSREPSQTRGDRDPSSPSDPTGPRLDDADALLRPELYVNVHGLDDIEDGDEDDELLEGDDEAEPDPDAQAGVITIEATEHVYGRFSKWCLFVGLALASYIYSLDASTTYSYLNFATSAFGGHALISAIQVAQSIILAVGKPVIAKVADVSSRGKAYVVVLCFYVVGYLVIATATHIAFVAAGILIYAVGYTGLQLLTSIIIADITPLSARGLVSALATAPFILNAFVGANISSAVLNSIGWRWGYAMFAILVPLALSPLVLTLLWAERKAKKRGLVDPALGVGSSPLHRRPPSLPSLRTIKPSKLQTFVTASEQLDLVGLTLLGSAVALILVPLTLSERLDGGWRDPRIPLMLLAGVACLGFFGYWDFTHATYPVVAKRFVRNRTVVITTLVGAFDFMAFYVTQTYLFSFILVVKSWSLRSTTYFTQIQVVSLSVFAIMGGVVMQRVRGYKRTLIVGLFTRVAGVILMIHSRRRGASAPELVLTQILQGGGGGLASVASQVGSQASVSHADVAVVIALVLLVTEIGAATGGAIAGAIWSTTMPSALERHLPGVDAKLRKELFGSIENATKYPHGSHIREGVVLAYDDTMKVMVLVATVISIIPLALAFFLPEWYLGNKQSAVDHVRTPNYGAMDDEDEEEGGGGIYPEGGSRARSGSRMGRGSLRSPHGRGRGGSRTWEGWRGDRTLSR
ncbi:MFS general substrate transporter [Punctularia strigosozonata HHB-11173 SS5]|uniref:MFS general substrate transporter n=1 Tax=Punctularia strigosozonata (strain HHB-11173) TaxID=741275 RepID=UPI0004417719|nr:MFS general substrate transporter [Punctularia strigosozonata HHB-11173 SS5]EIN05327.1 MFS general substrate transporter [Punctularia strigosozonata HHB-11173 SS5]